MLVGMVGAQLISWLSSDVPMEQRPSETFQKFGDSEKGQKSTACLKEDRVVGSWPP
jgi:hypothetical protein